jgi:hypothetical protein
MRLFIAILVFCPWAFLKANSESESEPSRDQAQVLVKAISALQESKIGELRSVYSEKEKTSYYLRDASFIARIQTPSGYRLVFRFTFVRSSPYRKDAITPPRGHTFAVVFDDSIHYLWHGSVATPDDLVLSGYTLKTADGQWKIDLRAIPQQKTEQGAAANP